MKVCLISQQYTPVSVPVRITKCMIPVVPNLRLKRIQARKEKERI